MEIKKVALISSFCDNEKKIDVLKKNISLVKSYNIDVILISPFILTKDVVELCDYFFVTKDNPVLDWPQKAMNQWRIFGPEDNRLRISTTFADYGYAGLNQIKQLSQIALNFDYDQFFHMIYDLKIDENVIEGLNSNKNNSVYSSKRDNTFWSAGLHYMIFDRDNLKNFISRISKESYLNEGSDAFVWLYSQKKYLNYSIENKPVEDEIYFYSDHDFFNFSPIEGLKFFIEKNDETLDTIKILFYDVKDRKKIKILIDTFINEIEIYDFLLFDLGFNKENMRHIKIEYEKVVYDITKIIIKIKHNTLSKV